MHLIFFGILALILLDAEEIPAIEKENQETPLEAETE
jgi:hypothetical protein